ncbi:MAG: hypothetical protein AAFO03_17415 [Bacteroidota bacterium]
MLAIKLYHEIRWITLVTFFLLSTYSLSAQQLLDQLITFSVSNESLSGTLLRLSELAGGGVSFKSLIVTD